MPSENMHSRFILLSFILLLSACDPTYIVDSADSYLSHYSNTGRKAAGSFIDDVPRRFTCGPGFACGEERFTYNVEGNVTELHLPQGRLFQQS